MLLLSETCNNGGIHAHHRALKSFFNWWEEESEDYKGREDVFPDNTILKELTLPKEKKDEKPLSPKLILTARVNSRTWIAIYIDDKPVKEYLFQPGETIRWAADKGFDILVGNAGGIEFFLNGEEVGDLGPKGKVIRVKLPKG